MELEYEVRDYDITRYEIRELEIEIDLQTLCTPSDLARRGLFSNFPASFHTARSSC